VNKRAASCRRVEAQWAGLCLIKERKQQPLPPTNLGMGCLDTVLRATELQDRDGS